MQGFDLLPGLALEKSLLTSTVGVVFSLQPAVDTGDFFHPLLAFTVLQVHDGIPRPVKVIRNIGYLLMQAVQGVA